MPQRRTYPLIVRWLSRMFASVAMVAAVSVVVALLERQVPVLSMLVLYLFAVLPVAVLWGARLAAAVSILSVVVFVFLFVPPIGSPRVADPRNVGALAVFLVTAIVVAELAARSRRTALESARLTKQQSALRRVATLVAQSVPPSAVFEAVTREVGLLSGADIARMERYEKDGSVSGVAAWSRVPAQLAVGTRFDLDGLSVARDVQESRSPVRLVSFAGAVGAIAEEARALGIRSSVGCPIVVAGRLWGVMAASTKSDHPFSPNTEAQIASFTELVATSIENAEARAELGRVVDQQAALRRVATLVARGVGAEHVFAAVAEEVGTLIEVEATAVVRFEPDGGTTFMGGHGWAAQAPPGMRYTLPPSLALASVRRTGKAARFDSDNPITAILPGGGAVEGIRSAVGAPIAVEGRLWGGIGVVSRVAPLPPDAERRMTDFAELVATAIGNAEARTKLMQSRARIVTTADETRRRIERDLHDGAQQRLVSLALALRLTQKTVPAQLPGVRASIGRVAEDLSAVLDELREISRGLHPAILSAGGLNAALRTLARRSAVPVKLIIETDGRYTAPLEIAAYYVVSEALTNAAKHADASQCEVVVQVQDSTLRLTVSDDGVGGAQPHQGSGLTGLHDRIEALGGSVHITSPARGGTIVEASLPINPKDGGTPPDRPAEA